MIITCLFDNIANWDWDLVISYQIRQPNYNHQYSPVLVVWVKIIFSKQRDKKVPRGNKDLKIKWWDRCRVRKVLSLWSSKGQVFGRWKNEFDDSTNLIHKSWISTLCRNESHYQGSLFPLPNLVVCWLEIRNGSSLPTAIKAAPRLQRKGIENQKENSLSNIILCKPFPD